MPAFLFTDIESSTRLWEEQPESMRSALARHDVILRQAIEQASGSVVKTTGDGMLGVFDAVSDAVRASLHAQTALAREVETAGTPIRVRMGVHVGDAESRDGDYFGPAMNRTARIMAAGHGGQILLSAAAAQLADGTLPAEAALRDLGSHRLKDLTLPEHLYQLLHPDLPSDFPALATLEARPNNLPMQTTEFFGRRDELAAIAAMLEAPTTRLVTLTGPGGAGKTRLGLQVAADHLGDFRDGVLFVDLAPETDAGSAYEAIVRALAYPTRGQGTALDVLKARLRDREMLLVLDNFEQVMPAAVGVAELIQVCPELQVLVTSREALRVRAERVFPVPPLALPHPATSTAAIAESEGVRLFSDRARAVRPDFVVTDENARPVAEICLRLDGLPLAIELAAARMNVFSPHELLERLRVRLDVLGAGGRDLPDRQRTLWGAIGWSYELLEPGERRIVEMMAVFAPARLAALEAVASAALGEESIVDTVASLVDKSLIRSREEGGSQWFSMLNTVREYAAERLAESGLEPAVRLAHAEHYSELAAQLGERLRGPDRESALAELAAAIGNLRAAWRYWFHHDDLEQILQLIDVLWALHDARGWYHSAIALARDALSVLASAAPSTEHSADELALRTSLARALMAVQGYTPEVEQTFKDVLAVAAAGDTASQRFPVLRALAAYYMNTGQLESAAELGRDLLGLAEVEDDRTMLLDGHYVFGAASALAGDVATGLHHLDRAIALFDPSAQPAGRFRSGPSVGVLARMASGMVLWQMGALEDAVRRIDDAVDVARRLQHPFSLAYALFHNGLLQLQRMRFDECRERTAELRRVAAEEEYLVWGTLASVLDGVALAVAGEPAEGLALTEAAVQLYRGLTTPPVFWPLILGMRGRVSALAGEPERGLALVEEGIATIMEFGSGGASKTLGPELEIARGDIMLMLASPDPSEALRVYDHVVETARRDGRRLIELQALTRIVELHRRAGFAPDRSTELRIVVETFPEAVEEHDVLAARAVLG